MVPQSPTKSPSKSPTKSPSKRGGVKTKARDVLQVNPFFKLARFVKIFIFFVSM
jgi:hypothetical protein